MENKSHAMIAGLFIISLSIALILAGIWFDRDSTERLPYELVTQASVAGLSPESAVRYRGLAVGKVDAIRFDPAVPGQILVNISVKKGTPITQSTYATLGYQGVTGLAYVQFDDDGKAPQLLETSPDKVARIAIRPGLFDKLAGNSEGLMLQVDQIAHRLNTLLDPENQKLLTHALTSLDTAAVKLGNIPQQLEPTLASLPQAVGDARKTLASFDRMAQDYSALAEHIQGQNGALDRINASLDHFNATASLVGSSVSRLDTMISTVNNDTLPRVGHLADTLGHSAQVVDKAVEGLGENPQSLIVGEPRIPPGPGEAGYRRP